jgi:hypothetical protein
LVDGPQKGFLADIELHMPVNLCVVLTTTPQIGNEIERKIGPVEWQNTIP